MRIHSLGYICFSFIQTFLWNIYHAPGTVPTTNETMLDSTRVLLGRNSRTDKRNVFENKLWQWSTLSAIMRRRTGRGLAQAEEWVVVWVPLEADADGNCLSQWVGVHQRRELGKRTVVRVAGIAGAEAWRNDTAWQNQVAASQLISLEHRICVGWR